MSKYWESRAAQRELESQLIASKYIARMEEQLRLAQANIIQQIEAFYSRYSIDNKISYAEAKKYVTAKELKDFRNITLQQYKALSLTGNPEYDRILDAIGYRARISRLEMLNLQIQMKVLELYGSANGLQAYTYTGLTEVYENSYYKTLYDIATLTGIYKPVKMLTDDVMKEVLAYNWSGKEFSKRIWGHEAKAMATIKNELNKSFMQGRSLIKTSRVISEATDVALSRAEALVRTEANFFHSLAANNSYIEADLDRYQILATLDHRTSEICQAQDLKIYYTKDYNPGTNAPPFHTRCRTTTVPYFDESEYMEGEQRLARDHSTNENDKIDSKINYEEWKHEFVSNDNAVITRIKVNDESNEIEYKVYPFRKSNINWIDYLAVDLKGSDILNKIHTELNEFMNTKRLEKLFLIDKITNSVAYELSGESIDKVAFTKDLTQTLKNSKPNSLVLTHVHPTKTPFSREDIRKIIDFKSIGELTLECADSSKYVLSRGNFKSSIFKTLSFDSKYEKKFIGKLLKKISWFRR